MDGSTTFNKGDSRRSKEVWLPILVFVGLAALAVIIWLQARYTTRRQLAVETTVTADHISRRLATWINDRVAIIDHLGERYSDQNGLDKDTFRKEATWFLGHFPGIQALNWIDADWIIRVIVPTAGNEPALNKDLHNHPAASVRDALARATETGAISRTSTINLLQGGKGFATYRPVRNSAGRIIGFINGVFRIDKVVDSCLSEQELKDQFRFDIHESDGRVVYSRNVDSHPHAWPFQTAVEVQVVDHPWKLVIAPAEAMLHPKRLMTLNALLVAGLTSAAGISWMVRLSMIRRRRLWESEMWYRTLSDDVLDNSQVGLFILDRNFRIVWINRATERYFGISRDEVLGQDKRELIRDRIQHIFENPERFARKVLTSYDDNTHVEQFECHVLAGEGREDRWLEHRSQPIESGLYTGGRIEHYYEITERREAEAKKTRAEVALLRRSEQLRVLLDSVRRLNAKLETKIVMRELVAAAIALTDTESGTAGLYRDGKMVFSEYNNRGDISPLDYTFDPGYGVPGWIIETREPYIANDVANDPHVIPEIRKTLGFYNLADVPIISRGGDLLGCFEIHNTRDRRPFTDEDVEMLRGLADQASVALENALLIDENRRMEAQLRQTQKMEAVGQLAGGVAHDFNNMLQAILGHIDLAMLAVAPNDPVRSDLEEARRAGQRAAELTRQLLAFSRRQVLAPQNLDLNELIDGLLKMLRRVIGEQVELSFISGHNLGSILADTGQIEQVIMNLCVNARDAMPKGGRITIETENVVIDERYRETHPWATVGRYVLLSVTDEGCGMDKETVSHIFEPFFTTKDVGRGTGLGLATVYGIVKQHEGLIHVYSDPGKGTTFKIYFPIVERAAVAVDNKIPDRVVGGTETILLAEDESMVRDVAQRVLKEAGYTVVAASDGREAIALFHEHIDEIDIAVLDVIMPNIGGKDVYTHIKEHKPDMPVLFSSGYSENAIHTQFILNEGMQLIQKPYDGRDLLRKVRELLDT